MLERPAVSGSMLTCRRCALIEESMFYCMKPGPLWRCQKRTNACGNSGDMKNEPGSTSIQDGLIALEQAKKRSVNISFSRGCSTGGRELVFAAGKVSLIEDAVLTFMACRVIQSTDLSSEVC